MESMSSCCVVLRGILSPVSKRPSLLPIPVLRQLPRFASQQSSIDSNRINNYADVRTISKVDR